jgi:uncharacterized ParB-like nuclease family protein
MATNLQEVPLDKINIYGGTQTRLKTNDDAIESYADEMMRGTVFPPINVYFDGTTYWLADGFHRFLATKRNERSTIAAEVQPGGRTEALRHALGANSTNGVYRTNGDKRNSVEIALEEWPELANPVISEICKVSAELVRNCRQAMQKAGRIPEVITVTGRDGKQYPGAVERQPRGKSEEPSSEKGGGGGGGAGGGFSKGKGDGGALGGSTNELEYEAREMIRNGEVNPFELRKMASATPNDYAAATIKLLEGMRRDDPKRREGLNRIKEWIERELRGENVVRADLGAAAVSGATSGKSVVQDAEDDDADEDIDDEDADEPADESADDDGDEQDEN